jgi:hypothetical protein
MRRRVGPILAWVVTSALLVYLFSRVPFEEVLDALKRGAPWTIPAAVGLVLLIYVADCFAMWKTFGWFVARLSLREVLVIRGATYLLAFVNYAIGQGAIVYFVNRTRGVPVARGAATILLIMGINVLVLLAMASAGLALGGANDRRMELLVVVGYAGLAIYLIALKLKPGFLTRRSVFQVLFSAGPSGHLKAFAVRIPHVLALVLFNHVLLHAFGVQIPLTASAMYLPVVFLTGIVPSFLGLGPTQASMIALISRFAPGDATQQQATILAASLATWTLAFLVQILVSLACLRSQLTRTLRSELPAPS